MTTATTDPKLLASHAALATAMKSKEHLKMWLDASGRRWLVFNGIDLVESLTFPEGAETLAQLVAAYRDYRRTLPTGAEEKMVHPDTKVEVSVPTMKGELLEVEELDRAIRYLVLQMLERKPDWRLEGDPL